MCKKTKYYGTSNTKIDKCIKPLIQWLKSCDYDTVACCCGHSKYPMTIIVKEIINGVARFRELFSDIEIKRNRRFYVKDKQKYYYIPELGGKKQ